MPKISVIVPVYNVQEYLTKCVDSILIQDFRDFELILIDDGSTDQSGLICENYLKMDGRVKVIHKENGGLSDARNVGLDCATGDFVTFIDSDDYIEQGMLSYMNELTNNLNVELFMFNYYLDEPEGRIRKKNETINEDELIILNKRDLVRVIFEDKLTAIIACTKLYSMKLFVDTRFPMKRRFEDLFIFFDIVRNVKTASYSSIPFYHYVTRCDSITNDEYRHRDLDYIFACNKNLNIIINEYPDLIELAYFKWYQSLIRIFIKMVRSGVNSKNKDFQWLINKFRKKSFNFLNCYGITRKRHLLFIIYYFFPAIALSLEKLKVKYEK